MATSDFDVPTGLSRKARRLAQGIRRIISEGQGSPADGGGCRAFYTPREWRERGESYGTDSVLVLVHDGGDLDTWLGYYAPWNTRIRQQVDALLDELGLYVEACTCWYSAVYEV